MTFIQPHKEKSILSVLLMAGIMCVVFGVFLLVVLYNHLVNVTHSIAQDKLVFQALELQNAELKNRILSVLDSPDVEKFTAQRGLVEEKKPEYLQVAQQWPGASQ